MSTAFSNTAYLLDLYRKSDVCPMSFIPSVHTFIHFLKLYKHEENSSCSQGKSKTDFMHNHLLYTHISYLGVWIRKRPYLKGLLVGEKYDLMHLLAIFTKTWVYFL